MSDQGAPVPPATTPLTPAQLKQQQTAQIMQAALRGGLPQFYANGFGIAQTATDVSLVLLTNGNPTGVLSISYTTAKTLLSDLDRALKNFERATNSSLKTAAELEPALEQMLKNEGTSKF
jgi:hypothetical protein